MADLIYTTTFGEYEQEEITETREVVGEDGIVVEETIFLQHHFKCWVTLEAEQKTHKKLGSDYRYFNAGDVLLRTRVHMLSNSTDFTFTYKTTSVNNSEIRVTSPNFNLANSSASITREFRSTEYKDSSYSKEIKQGEEYSYNSEVIEGDTATSEGYMPFVYFNTDGSAYVEFRAREYFTITGIVGGAFDDTGEAQRYMCETPGYSQEQKIRINMVPYNRGAIIQTADNFTDEENPSLTYQAPYLYTPLDGACMPNLGERYWSVMDELVSCQVALSLDGETPLIEYRDIEPEGVEYTFNFTEEEREILRANIVESESAPIYFITKAVIRYKFNKNVIEETFISTSQRIITIVGCYPTLTATVKDIKEETLALTGDEATFIKYESMAEYTMNAVASKHATIIKQTVTCGSKTFDASPNGVIQDVESANFIFYVLDSRSMAAQTTIFKNLVDYVKPTCYQKAEIELSGETGANIKLTINGNYYNGSFGAADNEFTLQARYTDDEDNFGEWITIDKEPTFNGTTYEVQTVLSGLDYGASYIVQCRIIDKLNTVESAQYTVKLLPVFDWSETDFNFNVPVNVTDTLNINNETIIRHNSAANNTVVSATGGHIYLRPRGTNDTSGETVINPDGSIVFGGVVDLSNGFLVDGNQFTDYIIESGETEMGTNGTWYWRKWASGKAECWGCRNFGNMAVNTAWGNLYRSEFLTQELPDNLFTTTPDVININIVNANFGGWICKHENLAPSAVTTGSFIFVRPASATITPTYIGFHVIGIWE